MRPTKDSLSHFLFLPYLFIIVSFYVFGWSKTWHFLQIDPLQPIFADMRTIQAGLDAYSSGQDPQISNPSDPWQRVMNYPSFWLAIADFLNLQQETNFLIFVVTQISVFVICIWHLVKKYPSVYWFPLCFSWSSLLCLERGNNDLLIFSLLFFALWYGNFTSVILISLATLLKIFPLLSLPAFAKKFRYRRFLILGVSIASLLNIGDLKAIRDGTPVAIGSSYGSLPFAISLSSTLGWNVSSFVISLFLSFLVVFLILVTKNSSWLCWMDANEKSERMFVAGSSIFIGTFLLGSNFDYRMIFLLLCVPSILNRGSKALKYIFLFLSFSSMSYAPLVALFGVWGSATNLLSKCGLFLVLSTITIKRVIKSDS